MYCLYGKPLICGRYHRSIPYRARITFHPIDLEARTQSSKDLDSWHNGCFIDLEGSAVFE